MRKYLFLIFFLFVIVGCTMDDRYNACMSDDDCRSQVMDVKDHTYALTKVGVQSTPMPNVAEIIAVLVSNVVAFGVGVLKGKRKI